MLANVPDQDYLKNYDLLKDTGLLEQFDNANYQIKSLQKIISQAVEILNQESIEELIDYVIQCFNDMFIPSYLLFVLQDMNGQNQVSSTCFRNMKKIAPLYEFENLEPFKDFFKEYPNSISFSLFEYKMNNPSITNAFKQFNTDIIVPVLGMGGLYGFIVFGNKIVEEEYNQQELEYIGKIVKFISISLQNNIHYRSAVTDVKTGLYNHSFFMKRFEEEMDRIKRYGGAISLMVIDVDFFKKVNDQHGHLAGDEVLMKLANTILHVVRKVDIPARFGGEEFTVLMPMTGRKGALGAAERLRKKVEDMEIEYDNKKLKITVSIGISYSYQYRWLYPLEMIEQADQALYASKDNGRNRVTVNRRGLLQLAEEYRSELDGPI